MASTDLDDVIVPEVFTGYVQTLSEEKSRIIQSGAVMRDPLLDGLLVGAGLRYRVPGWNDLAQTDENISSDDPGATATPDPITSHTQIAIRLSRNKSWGSMDLAAALAGPDPMDAIANLVAEYRARRLQKMLIAMVGGVSKDNGVNDTGDYAFEIVGGAFVDGVTNFSAEAYIDAAQTMGDSSDSLSLVVVHSVVYARMKKNNLIDFIPDSQGVVNIPTFLGASVVVDDGMPSGTAAVRADGTAAVAGMYESWLFGPGAIRLGVGSPLVPTETDRLPSTGNGAGQGVLYNRWEWLPHLSGHAYVGTDPADGGPSNAATTHNLNIATSWNRVWSERKMVKFARLITRES